MVEQGNAQAAIDNPRHASTRLLSESIPVPDPDVRRDERPELPEELAGLAR
ncbi:MAG TPA: hypothetical protein VER55_16920 [Ardenticatenaceae bacterium]|nr:hypothetical protein [Ardenticatenaceae bacterium]